MNKRLVLVVALVVPVFLIAGAKPIPPPPNNADLVCEPDGPMDSDRYLRSLSLDLRGVVPTVDEHAMLAAAGEESVDMFVDDWLASDAFADRFVRLHRGLLWNNVSNLNLINNRSNMRRDNDIYWRNAMGEFYRGDNVSCLDQPADFDAAGNPILYPQPDGTMREGWVMVSPYWDPTTSIRVCALDAQANMVAANGVACDTIDGYGEMDCGCGPNLNWCDYQNHDREVLAAFARDVEMRIADLILADGSYLDLFSARTAYVNGPIVHYLRWQTKVPANVRLTPVPYVMETLPDLEFTDADTWVAVELGPEHAGVLSSPVFLLRFQTNRARANRFYNTFLCQPFSAPDGGLPDLENAVLTLDLQEREGCKYCHALLEPGASYWGRWAMGGAGYLDPVGFPPLRDDCAFCATEGIGCSTECNRYYVTSALAPEETEWLGWLISYEFRRDEHMDHPELGPKALVDRTVVDGRLPRCVTLTATKWLLGRDPTPDEEPWIQALTADFMATGFSYRALVKSIVSSPVYRRVR